MSISKTPLNPKTPLKWVFMGIIRAISSKILRKDTNSSNYLLIVDNYYRIIKLYGTKNITAEEVIDKLDVFQARFVKVDEFGWWDMEIIQTDVGTHFIPKEFQ